MSATSPAQSAEIPLAETALQSHFGKPLHELVTSSRTFPISARVDVQLALEKLFGSYSGANLLGLHAQYAHETITVAHLMGNRHYPVIVGPLQHEEIDIGEVLPARCLRMGLWLARESDIPFAMLVSPGSFYGRPSGTHLEVAVPPGEAGMSLSRKLLDDIEAVVRQTSTYRGKVISLEELDRYSGQGGALRVHRLKSVRREEVILPEKTLQLIDRNIRDFVCQRGRLQELGMPIKKGVLFYGPPGTGKTHTIHYLASQLPDHTTLLVTAEQVGLLDHYFQLARFLQPAMLVIEDVDLIARMREEMHGPCEESLLNKLLNEMDGLREDAAVLFVLTTNRPEHLESALASRPGRIDQAIEFPLPDEQGRRQLIRLYSCGLALSDEIVQLVVRRTERGSAAFIKELMRRAAQFYLQEGKQGNVKADHINSALEEMLFSGGSLNAKLLGAAAVDPLSIQ
jgi:ATPase family associated with various cellular activities (AAA)